MGCGSAEDTGANQERAAAITPAPPWKIDTRARHQGGGVNRKRLRWGSVSAWRTKGKKIYISHRGVVIGLSKHASVNKDGAKVQIERRSSGSGSGAAVRPQTFVTTLHSAHTPKIVFRASH